MPKWRSGEIQLSLRRESLRKQQLGLEALKRKVISCCPKREIVKKIQRTQLLLGVGHSDGSN